MIARERLIEIAVSVGGVGVMVALLYVIGLGHTTEQSDGHMELSSSGGELVVFSLVAFVVLMALAGLVLIYTVTVVEARDDLEGDGSSGT